MDKIIKPIFVFSLIISSISGYPQFPPAAGQEGSTAISKDSSVFIAYAVMCEVERGYKDISMPDSGYVDFGEEGNALGQADNNIISLGDGGIATLGFHVPIYNGEGFDFCVFENALNDTFLELAFVEVSSDGENFFRFPATSLTQTETQTGTFGATIPEKINNLAGKYRLFFGTPFDLEEMNNIPGLNVDSITQIRIIDVVGSIDDSFATFDSQGNKINDPWPTAFATGGFDLDAVAVIHNLFNQDISENREPDFRVFPNPVLDHLNFESSREYHIELLTLEGKIVFKAHSKRLVIGMGDFPKGIYLLKVSNDKGCSIRKIIKK
ncbi:MAG: T9SS type A sorting domain-containing protein [Chlorobi bacterium]|nr:T9SS type A sorting domain-containing protein [Chlorobiota bacterium]